MQNGRFKTALTLLAFPAAWLCAWGVGAWDWNQGGWRALATLGAFGVAAGREYYRKYDERFRLPHKMHRAARNALMGTVFVLGAAHVVIALQTRPGLIDIATSTIIAGDSVAIGQNPYHAPIDPHPELQTPGHRFDGYKYPPMMILDYLPLTHFLRERGVTISNLLFELAIAALLLAISGGPAAAVFYLLIPFVPDELYQEGVTDLSALVALLAALYLDGKKPFLRGALVGLSLSTKQLPALAWVVLLSPTARNKRQDRLRYLGGIALGLLPCAAFWLWSPNDFWSNIVLYNTYRLPDSTSWAYGYGPWAQLAQRTLLGLTFLGIFASVRVVSAPPVKKWLVGLALTLGFILSGPIDHRNYQLWWFPILALILGSCCKET